MAGCQAPAAPHTEREGREDPGAGEDHDHQQPSSPRHSLLPRDAAASALIIPEPEHFLASYISDDNCEMGSRLLPSMEQLC